MQPARAIQGSYGPVLEPPIIVQTTATGTPATITADLASPEAIRRLRIVNLDATNAIAVLLVRAGESLTGLTAANGIRVPAGGELSLVVSSRLRIGVVSAAGTPTYNAVISDL